MRNDASKSPSHANSALADYYGDGFYDDQIEGSLKSAKKYVDFLKTIFRPDSVVDVGCGRGAWLKAFKDVGATKVVGFDGAWNNQQNMIDQSIEFHGVDLNASFASIREEKYDLAITLEVAEHLEPSSAENFVRSLTHLSDVVMFGAAYTEQGGSNHINEQPHTYWANIFASFNYVPYDIFRPVFWGDLEVEYWYQQNTFLYVKRNSEAVTFFLDAGYQPMKNIGFMNCVHPALYSSKLSKAVIKQRIKRLILEAIPSALRPFARKVTRFGDQ